jgi:hypothetical protein
MAAREFEKFRLVGGTSLSLQIGHRLSVDIDLFTDEEYGSVDFKVIDRYLRENFPYIQTTTTGEIGMGQSYFIGENDKEAVKLDLFYTEKYITPVLEVDDIRLASKEDIIAMKFEIIGHGGRKKDFWDIHDLMSDFSFSEMINLYEKKYPYSHDTKTIKKQFTNFEIADGDPDPICLKNKQWEIIKLDLMDFVNQ